MTFSLLEEDPLCYFTVWARSKQSPNDPKQNRPFRFPTRPTEDEIETELGNDFIQDVMYEDRLKPVEMQRPRQPLKNLRGLYITGTPKKFKCWSATTFQLVKA